ncbi:flagellar motor protein MotB [Methylobacterium durans]|uniref:Flagellar motor protein MotB n=1 Tax=Methylobacterium durans TaxID=2202825 RepID=A0A2U8W8L3_9HYPH|nr:flagellar motor protein MotB [Methylobacterium durans]AWN41652.1 flagellar motor protein MotB [Methylobacterium durans]
MISKLLPPAFRQRYGWLLGLPVLALLWAAATLQAQPEVERAVETAARGGIGRQEAVDATGETWFRLAARGRDLHVEGDAPDVASRETLLRHLSETPGTRRIMSSVGLVEEASPFVWTATQAREDRIDLSGSRPAEIGRTALATRLTSDLPASVTLADAARAARGGPRDFLAAAAFAVARLRALTPGAVATLRDTTLSLQGEAAGPDAYDALRADLANLPAGFSAGRIEILPPRVADFSFGVERRADGGLILTGFVVSEAARSALRRAAQEAAEGAFVDDRTRTARGLGPGVDPDALTRFALDAAGLLRDGRVSFDGARVSAEGNALDGQAIAEVEALLRERRPPGVSLGRIAVGAAPLSPYRVALRRDADTVTLTGHLPDAAARERILAAIRPRFVRERVVDRTRLAAGAPGDLVSVLGSVIPQLALLANGELTVADRDVRLSGESLYPESGRRLAATLPTMVPAAWRASATIGTPGAPARRDAESCRRDFAAETRAHPLHFAPGTSAFSADFYPVLDAVAALAKLCPDLRIEIAGHVDPPGTPREKPAGEGGAIQTTASIDKAEEAKDKAAKDKAAKAPPADKKAPGKATKAAKSDKTDKAEAAPAEPEPDLARLRAQAIVEYLLQAGAASEQVAPASGTPEAAVRAVAFSVRG